MNANVVPGFMRRRHLDNRENWSQHTMSLPTVIPGPEPEATGFAGATLSTPYIAAARIMVGQWKDERLKNLRPLYVH